MSKKMFGQGLEGNGAADSGHNVWRECGKLSGIRINISIGGSLSKWGANKTVGGGRDVYKQSV